MLTDFSRLLYLTLLDLLRRARLGLPVHLPLTAMVLALPGRLEEWHCAWRMELMVRRMRAMGKRIALVHDEVRRGRNVAAIRRDARFRAMLAVVRSDMRLLQIEALAWQRDRQAVPGVRLGMALRAVVAVSEQVYTQADRLIRELE